MKTIEIIGKNYSGAWSKTRIACRGIVSGDGKLLLSYETKTGQWSIPGGGLEGCESEKACCIRELAEETGKVVEASDCVLEIDEYYGNFRFINRYFLCNAVGETEMHLTEREARVGAEPRWLPTEQILDIFSKYADYTGNDEMRRGMYLREYTALCEVFRRTALPREQERL